MKERELDITLRAASLRREFDSGFAAPPVSHVELGEGFIAVRLGGDRYLIRLAEIAGIHRDKRVTRLPSDARALLGIGGDRGRLIPVYDLAVLMGYPAVTDLRWSIMTTGQRPVLLAIAALEEHLNVPTEMLAVNPKKSSFTAESARLESGLCPVAHLPSIVSTIEKAAQNALQPREE